MTAQRPKTKETSHILMHENTLFSGQQARKPLTGNAQMPAAENQAFFFDCCAHHNSGSRLRSGMDPRVQKSQVQTNQVLIFTTYHV